MHLSFSNIMDELCKDIPETGPFHIGLAVQIADIINSGSHVKLHIAREHGKTALARATARALCSRMDNPVVFLTCSNMAMELSLGGVCPHNLHVLVPSQIEGVIPFSAMTYAVIIDEPHAHDHSPLALAKTRYAIEKMAAGCRRPIVWLETPPGEMWQVRSFPAVENGEAVWPERFSRDKLQELEAMHGKDAFEREYMLRGQG